ncbi:MAG: Uma2 family endonuclease [Bryobacteraceae bacterium]
MAIPSTDRGPWTRDECEHLIAAGQLDGRRFELIEGELVSRIGEKRPHLDAVNYVSGWFERVFGKELAYTEAPIDVAPQDNPTSEPEPDVSVLKKPGWRFEKYAGRADIHLVVEVSDTTLAYDLSVKAGLYARAGILEYWVLDAVGRKLFVHRAAVDGRYTEVRMLAGSDGIAPLAASDEVFVVAAVFEKWAEARLAGQ